MAAKEVYEKVVSCYDVESGSIGQTTTSGDVPLITIHTAFKQKIATGQLEQTFVRDHVIMAQGKDLATGAAVTSLPPVPVAKVQARSRSPSGKYLFLAYEEGNVQYVELQGEAGTILRCECKALHGAVYAPGTTFGSISWSALEDAIFYVAEADGKRDETTSWWGSDKEQPSGANGLSTKYEAKLNWGEGHSSACNTVLFHLINKPEVYQGVKPVLPINNHPDLVGKTVGQVRVVDFQRVVFVAWDNGPASRLGVQYCKNRPTTVYLFDRFDMSLRALSEPYKFCALEPQLSPSGKHVTWMQYAVGGPHGKACDITVFELADREATPSIVLPAATSPEDVGVYVYPTAPSIWLNDTSFVVATQQGALRSLAIVSIESNTTTVCASTQAERGTWTPLYVMDNKVLAKFTTPAQPCEVKLGVVNSDESDFVWHTISSQTALDLKWDIVPCTSFIGDTVVIQPRTKPTKTVVVPHGGPHSIVSADFYALYASFALAGMAVVMPNYRGSLGFGNATAGSLLGKCGTQDVQDVIAQIDECIAKYALDPTNLFVFGGSHGGFLTAHLTSQFPDKFRAAAMRNPVIDIASMVYVTDIPDWCMVECGLEECSVSSLTIKELDVMRQASPLPNVDKVKAPTLVLLGLNDLRVPPFQGKLWFDALRQNGVDAHLFQYPDDAHPLSSLACESDVFVNVFHWFSTHSL
eukprot:m.3741 g.3741  ORF g.3741 m.3741 type:complete len:696 (+) comp4301_c0_seq1:152-2239(+)